MLIYLLIIINICPEILPFIYYKYLYSFLRVKSVLLYALRGRLRNDNLLRLCIQLNSVIYSTQYLTLQNGHHVIDNAQIKLFINETKHVQNGRNSTSSSRTYVGTCRISRYRKAVPHILLQSIKRKVILFFLAVQNNSTYEKIY